MTFLKFTLLTLLPAFAMNSPAVARAAEPAKATTGAAATKTLRPMLAPQTLHSTEATLIWDKAGSGSTYEIMRDGKPIGTTTKTHFTATDLTPSKDYIFTIRTLAPSNAKGAAANSDAGAKAEVIANAANTAPATSETIVVRTPGKEIVISVADHGAIGDGTTLNTKALQAAINACPKGGIVLIPKGVFLTGALYLKSDMTLLIAKDGVLKGTANPKDYTPFNRNRFEGWEMETHASLLNAGKLDRTGPANIRNLSIRGEGKISGGGKKLYDATMALYKNKVDGLRARGRLILLMNAENVEIAGLAIEESPGWTLHYIYSQNISIHDLAIRSRVHNGDGIDPDSSKNSYIFNTSFDTGDDCIAIKSGKNPEGNAINRPTENVRIFDCRFDKGHGISIGSEMSGGVRGVLIEDCVAGDLLHGVQIKATPERGGFVEDVTVRDCDLRKITILTALPYNNDGEAAPAQPFFRNFRFENIDLSKADSTKPIILVNGFPAEGHETANVTFANLKLPAGAIVTVDRSVDVSFANIATANSEKPSYKITRSRNVTQ